MSKPPRSRGSSRPPDPASPGPVDFKLMDRARAIFEEAFPADALPGTWSHGNRTFTIHDYLGFILLALYVPTCDSLRGLCKASDLEEFRVRYGSPAMDLASVSKAQAHVPVELLVPVISRLACEVREQSLKNLPGGKGAPGGGADEAGRIGGYFLRVVDSSVFSALPKMTWALFGAGRKRNDGKKTASVRWHVCFDPIALCPMGGGEVGSAAVDEKATWAALRKQDRCAGNGKEGETPPPAVQIGDRNYGGNYTMLSELTDEGANYVVRIKESASFTVEEELPVGAEERAAGIIRHAWGRLGRQRTHRDQHRVRLVWIGRPEKTIVLATNLEEADVGSATVAGMYGQRWEIEFFFWWLKRILKAGHWLALSEKGVRMQLYHGDDPRAAAAIEDGKAADEADDRTAAVPRAGHGGRGRTSEGAEGERSGG